MGVENGMFWREIELGFGEPDGTLLPKIPPTHPPPPTPPSATHSNAAVFVALAFSSLHKQNRFVQGGNEWTISLLGERLLIVGTLTIYFVE